MDHKTCKDDPAELSRRLHDAMHRLSALRGDEVLHLMIKSGLTVAQVITLHILRRRGTLSVSEIAVCVKLSRAATSHLVDRLVQRRLVRRSESAADRRQKQIALTAEGRSLVERLERAHLANVTGMMGLLPPETRQRFADVLCQVADALERAGAQMEQRS